MKKSIAIVGVISIIGFMPITGCGNKQTDTQLTASAAPTASGTSITPESGIEPLKSPEVDTENIPIESNSPNKAVKSTQDLENTETIVQASGNKQKNEEYQKKVSKIINKINKEANTLAKANTKAKNYKEAFLNTFNAMDEGFSDLAALTVPEEYAKVEPLAKEASEKMTEAVKIYKKVLNSKQNDKKSVKKKFKQAETIYLEAVDNLEKIVTIITADLAQ